MGRGCACEGKAMWGALGVRRVLAYSQPVDLRKSINGLVGVVKSLLEEDPLSGSVFVFLNRRGNYLKLVFWDRTGWCLVANYPSSYYTSFGSMRGFCGPRSLEGRRAVGKAVP